MYGLIWRLLPGTVAIKIATAAGLLLVVTAVLWYLVFPWAEPKIQFDHGTVDGSSSARP
ncbi:MAG: hypothetical protein JWN00_1003 [Actinomycetia bacterium]|jgi:hypothetical protein|nr:hypothetical protein [Actinomycetes bacterium]